MPGSSGFYGSQVAKNSSQPEIIVIVNCALNVPLILLSIFGNAVVLAAIFKTPSLRSSSILLLCSLAVSDLFVGTLIQPLYIASVLTRNKLLDSLWFTVSFAACGISLCTITAISVDRFLALHYHMRYPSLVTKSRTIYSIAIIWLLILLLSAIYYLNPFVYFFLVALGVGIFFIDINSRLHWDLQNRQTSKTTDQYSTASGASFNNRKSFQLQTVEDQCAKFVCVLYCYGCVLYANVHHYNLVSRN